MAIDDRDWYRDALRKKTGYTERADFRGPADSWYNPKLFRRDRVPTAPPAPSRRPPGASWLVIVACWLLAFALVFGAFKFHDHYQKQKRQAQASAIAAEYWKEQAEKAMQQNAKKPKVDFFK